MCQAEIFGNQSSSWLICCYVNSDRVPGISESSPQSVIAFASMSFSFHPTGFLPVPTHLEFTTRECPMAPRRSSKGRCVTQGSRAESLPGLTVSSVQIKKNIQCTKWKECLLSDFLWSPWFLVEETMGMSQKHTDQKYCISKLFVS